MIFSRQALAFHFAQMTAEDARHEVEAAVGAARAGAVLFVIHGVGTGKVRTSVLASLRNNKRVRRTEQQEGSNGTSLVGWWLAVACLLVGFLVGWLAPPAAHSRPALFLSFFLPSRWMRRRVRLIDFPGDLFVTE